MFTDLVEDRGEQVEEGSEAQDKEDGPQHPLVRAHVILNHKTMGSWSQLQSPPKNLPRSINPISSIVHPHQT